jgi:hypothetical protein
MQLDFGQKLNDGFGEFLHELRPLKDEHQVILGVQKFFTKKAGHQ